MSPIRFAGARRISPACWVLLLVTALSAGATEGARGANDRPIHQPAGISQREAELPGNTETERNRILGAFCKDRLRAAERAFKEKRHQTCADLCHRILAIETHGE